MTDPKVKLIIHHDPPPIPLREFDWMAYDDNSYDGPGSIIGVGPTSEAAVIDFWAQWRDRQ